MRPVLPENGRILENDAPAKFEEDDADVHNMQTHGAKVNEQWIFGLRQGTDCR